YGLWRYAGFLMTGGVQAAKAERRHGYVAFRPPSRWRRMGQTRKARAVRDSAAKKIGRHCHVSAAFARAELMGFVGLLLADKKRAATLAAGLELDGEEIALLMGSAPTTKKVQSIFEEAIKIRMAEEVEGIELAWHTAGTSQQPLGGAPLARAAQAQADGPLTKLLQASERPASDVETELSRTKPAAQAVGPKTEEAEAAAEGQKETAPKPEARKRGRPKKAEGEGKAEAKPGAGKRQKSLFDF
ncbi:MAG: replication factor C large subunit, partial [Methanotrichaceae archaeon]|nr:replication factor C large subunit [Methanotrichaceae archaeon]